MLMVVLPPLTAHSFSMAEMLRMRISMQNLLLAGVCITVWALLMRTSAGNKQRFNSWQHALVSSAWTISSCTAVAALMLLYHPSGLFRLEKIAAFAGISAVLLLVARLAVNLYRVGVQPTMKKPRIAVIVGAGWRGQRLRADMLQHPRWNYQLLGYVDTNPPNTDQQLLCDIDGLEELLIANVVDEVFITLPVKSMYDSIQKAIEVCERSGVQSRYYTDLFSTQITKRISTDYHHPSSVLLHLVHDEHGYVVKRVMDISGALICLVLLSPIMLISALAIRLTSRGPVLFRQQRFGLNRRLFSMYKFRTMVVDAEKQLASLEHLNETGGATFKLKHDPRVTPVGRFLRKTSLDELPQLFNVLAGNMSLVGPRPLPTRDVNGFSEAWLMRRFSVAPGITGLWQVSGRSNITFSNWIELDLNYIDNWSLTLDLKILIRTIPAVLKGSGAV
ncbi:MAG: sugar transferase [Janthinobacterium lividum]